MEEKELFEPIKQYFEAFGYAVDGEVKECDMVMMKDDVSIGIELKKTIDFKVIQQASLRQKYLDIVFVGIPMPSDLRTKAFRNKVYLLKRLGIGLLLVGKRTGNVELYSEPYVHEIETFRSHNKKKGKQVLDEFKKRRVKGNVGGVTKTTILTGYKEDSLMVLNALYRIGGSGKCKDIRKLCGVSKTYSIVYNNFNGWFEKIDTGIYRITEAGYEAIEQYQDIIKKLVTVGE